MVNLGFYIIEAQHSISRMSSNLLSKGISLNKGERLHVIIYQGKQGLLKVMKFMPFA